MRQLNASRPDYVDDEDPLILTYWVENPVRNERLFSTEPFGTDDTVTREGNAVTDEGLEEGLKLITNVVVC
jgi:hypothetical protein